MIHFFALDPALARDFESFRFCAKHCGPGTGRLISDLPPGEWVRACVDEVNIAIRERALPPVKGEAVKKRLKRLRASVLQRPGSGWDYSGDWLEDALVEHKRDSFAAMISHGFTSDSPERCFRPDEIDEDSEHWDTPTGIFITRSPGSFVDAVFPMLEAAKEIHLIDRGLSVDSDRMYMTNLRDLLQRLGRIEPPFPKVRFHTCPSAEFTPSFLRNFEADCRAELASLLPRNCEIEFRLWRLEGNWVERGAHPMHNRYVLTDYCGVEVGYGCDSAKGQTDVEDHVHILDQSLYKSLWNRARGKAPFPGLILGNTISILSSSSGK